jgi:hypothetical protein
MMDRYIADVVSDLSRQGFRFEVVSDDRLAFIAPAHVIDRHVKFIRHHKTQIIKFLNAQPRGVVIEFADHYVPF